MSKWQMIDKSRNSLFVCEKLKQNPRTFSQFAMMTTLGSFSAVNSSLAARFFSCL